MTLRASTIATAAAVGLLMGLFVACGGSHYESSRPFEQQLAVISPHDEPGGRFDGAQVSPGFGILYINGYTSETASAEGCGGFFGEEPEHVLEVDFTMDLKLVIQSSDDLVLSVVGPDGSMTCWDQASLSNANVSLAQRYEQGRYDVFVGPTEWHTTSAYRLVLSE